MLTWSEKILTWSEKMLTLPEEKEGRVRQVGEASRFENKVKPVKVMRSNEGMGAQYRKSVCLEI